MSYTFDSWRPSDGVDTEPSPEHIARKKRLEQLVDSDIAAFAIAFAGGVSITIGVTALAGKNPELQEFILGNGYNAVKYGWTCISAGLGLTALGSFILYRNSKIDP